MSKVFAYLRVSTTAQISGDGFTRQLIAIRKYCTGHKLKVERIFREKGISGSLKDRPQLNEMLLSLENGLSVKTIIIERLDRLGRDLAIQEYLIQQFQRAGVKLISVYEGEDLQTDEPTRKLLRQLLGAISEFDKEMLVGRLQAARQRKIALTGRCGGRLPYGSTKEEALTIRNMKYLRKTGKTYAAIADHLNSKNIPSATGKIWSKQVVFLILKRTTKRKAA